MKLDDLKKIANTFSGTVSPEKVQEIYAYIQKMGYDPDNLYQELEMDSKYVDTHRDTSYSGTPVSLHSHIFYELLYCRYSCDVEYLIGSNRYLLQPGDIVIVPPGISHRPILPVYMETPYKRDIIWISMDFFHLIQQMIPDELFYHELGTTLLRTAGTKWESLGKIFEQGILETEKKAPGWEIAVLGNTIQLLTQLHRAIIDDKAVPLKAEKPDIINQIMAYVENHLSDKITLSDMANRFYVSESTIVQSFRKKMGVSFYRCVTQQRLISAKNLILEGMLLEDISHQVGFTDYSTFYRAFKQEYGISPRQYRTLQNIS